MRICVIAAIHAEQSHENQSEEVGHWRLAAMANCVSVVSALVKSQSLTTVITSSLSGKFKLFFTNCLNCFLNYFARMTCTEKQLISHSIVSSRLVGQFDCNKRIAFNK